MSYLDFWLVSLGPSIFHTSKPYRSVRTNQNTLPAINIAFYHVTYQAHPLTHALGTTIRVKATIIQHGKTMALLRGAIESKDGKIVYATAEHHKVSVPALPEFADRLRKYREKSGQRPKGKL